jgi:hypothetical protein
MVLALEILSYLTAEKSASDGVVWIAAKLGGVTGIINVHEKRASVGAIKGAGAGAGNWHCTLIFILCRIRFRRIRLGPLEINGSL